MGINKHTLTYMT